ncbi:unnamed protein product [Cuscuta campestris]|uniref:Uncharacterized protein n=1 Tax=Cuscuta campestris TaxID=132261 RepID=A0A484LDP8_9ASTE|nr:unnamed protein product [Cuscuta campestris]
MLEKSNKRKKCYVSEDDVSALLDRYDARTVLALLQEVAQVPDVKIDWNELVKKTTTGIKNAREYQMLWRHLAYRHGLVDRLDDGALPLEDDSDLECELEATPAVGSEASAEAAAYVKVIIASGMLSESCLSNGTTVEAPLTINIPTAQTCRNPSENSCQSISMQGTNITIPVSVQIQPSPIVTTAEGLDTNGTCNQNLPPRRKRKPWSEAEDLELIAAVQKCGEGNWANILKGDFKGERTASQLSQRWAIIRKRQGPSVGNSSQLSEAQLAARRAMSLALDMPRVDNLKAASSITSAVSNAAANINHGKPAAAANINHGKPAAAANINHGKPAAAAANINHGKPAAAAANTNHAKPAAATNINHAKPAAAANINHAKPAAAAAQQDLPMAAAQKLGMAGPPKPRVPSKPTTPTPDSMVKAAAVAAGARIATPSDAATLLKAAQSKNAVRITPGGGGPLVKPPGTTTLPSNVHFIRTGLLSHSKTMPNPTRTGKPAPPSVGHQRNTILPSSTVPSGPKPSPTNMPPNGTNPKTIPTSGPKMANGTNPIPEAEHDTSKTAEIPTEKPNHCNAASGDKKDAAAKENGQGDHQGPNRDEEKNTQPVVVVNKSHIGETQTGDRNASSTVDKDKAT